MARTSWVFWSLCALALGTLARVCERAARACSPIPFAVHSRHVLPLDGSRDVGRGAIVLLVYALGGQRRPSSEEEEVLLDADALTEVTVREAGSEAALEGEVTSFVRGMQVLVRFRPLAALAPSTTYEVLDRAQPTQDTLGPLAVVATFTTGDGFDTTAPEAPHADISQFCQPCSMCDGCGGHFNEVRLTWWPGPDDAWIQVTHESGTVAWSFGDSMTSRFGGFDAGDFGAAHDGVFEVRFIDTSGNRSEPTLLAIEAQSCAGPEPNTDRLSGDVLGGADNVVEAEPRSGDASGCASGATLAGALAWLGLPTLWLHARRRRRRALRRLGSWR